MDDRVLLKHSAPKCCLDDRGARWRLQHGLGGLGGLNQATVCLDYNLWPRGRYSSLLCLENHAVRHKLVS